MRTENREPERSRRPKAPSEASGTPMSRRRFVQVAFACAAGAGAMAALPSCTRADAAQFGEPARATAFVFDTVVSIEAYAPQDVADEAAELCRHYESLFSNDIATSDIARINSAGGEPVEVDPDTADVIVRALDISQRTDGLFDITVGSVSKLWDFVEGVRPDDDAIAEGCSHIGWRGIGVDGATVTLADPDASLDLGGIGKGYVAGKLVELLSARGCASALLDLGGDVYALGTKPDGSAWRVGVKDPDGNGAVRTVEAHDAAVATSGTYERSFSEGGAFYHHILDPTTGMPAATDLQSATALCESPTDADALATALVLMGSNDAQSFAQGTEGLSFVLVADDGSVREG